MNVTLPKKEKTKKRVIALYIISISVCIIAAIVVAVSQYYGTNDFDEIIIGGTDTRTQEEIVEEELKASFDNIFTNQLEEYQISSTVKKIDENKEIVYNYYEKQEMQENNYEIDVCIPIINIDNKKIEEFNKAIQGDFLEKAESVLETKNKNTIYNVEYVASITDEILSLMIRSNLKDGSSAQRVIIQTYHFDLKNNKEITLEDYLNKRDIQVPKVESKVKNEIEEEQKKVDELKALGYNIFSRDVDDEMYKVKNTEEFFVKDGRFYLIYAYGNTALTSEMDLVII